MDLIVRELGVSPYDLTYDAMRRFTGNRTPRTLDEIWLLEHPSVFTLGLAGQEEHLVDPGDIPVAHVDRGGQVTYHGPGQLIAYIMLDLKRAGWGVKKLVSALEQSVIDFLSGQEIVGSTCAGAPGVYVGEKKIAALGLRVKGGCTYHGLALNVAMDLRPFERINPCGFPGLEVTQLREVGFCGDVKHAGRALLPHLLYNLRAEPVEVSVARALRSRPAPIVREVSGVACHGR